MADTRQQPIPRLLAEQDDTFQAALSIDGLRLLLAQSEIAALEPMVDVQMDDRGSRVGILQRDDEPCPVYFPSATLQPVADEFVATRRICVVLRDGSNVFGIACDAVEMHKHADVREVDLPEVMQVAGNDALDGLAIVAGHIVCRISTVVLRRLMSDTHEVTKEPRHASAA